MPRKNEGKILPRCENYVDDRTCLTCPYEDGKQPCLYPRAITIYMDLSTYDLIRGISTLYKYPQKEIVKAIFAVGLSQLKPEVVQKVQSQGAIPMIEHK